MIDNKILIFHLSIKLLKPHISRRVMFMIHMLLLFKSPKQYILGKKFCTTGVKNNLFQTQVTSDYMIYIISKEPYV